jgi:hypothetical protein
MEKPKTIIVDIDGTISTSAGRREPFDLKKVIHDDPINSVIEVIQALEDCQYVIVYLTARGEEARHATKTWLSIYAGGYGNRKLFMRSKGDTRDDVTIKSEIYYDKIEPKYDVKMAFDDNTDVLKFWESIGIKTFQVNDAVVS